MLQLSRLPVELLEQVRKAFPQDVALYLVGGAVRDAMLDKNSFDLDFALAGDVLKASRRAANRLGAAYFPLDQERDTARLVLVDSQGNRRKLDFAAFRGPDLESDLKARDFTINAMALPLDGSNQLIDPLGGRHDLWEKVIRTCSPGALFDDPLRTLRGIRLAVSLNYRILPDTNQRIRHAAPLLSRISPERVRDEIFRILEGKRPATAFRLLDRLDVLEYILPELLVLKDISQSPPHVTDVWNHTLDAVSRLEIILDVLSIGHDPELSANWTSGMLSLRLGRYRQQLAEHLGQPVNPERSVRGLLFLGMLFHDAGKPATRQVNEAGRIRFINHEKVSTELIGERGRQLRLSNDEIRRLETIVLNHMRPILLSQMDTPPTRRAIYRFFRATNLTGIDIGLVATADTLATYGSGLPRDTWNHFVDVIRSLFEAWWENRAEQLTPSPLVNGNDLMKIYDLEPGPFIGQLLELLREAQAEGTVNNREQALSMASAHVEAYKKGAL